MHELSLAYSLVETVTEALDEIGAGRVRTVRLTLGALVGVVPEALQFGYEVATLGTPLEGSKLLIREVPVVIHCPTCDRLVELPGVQRFRCPICETPSGDIRQGMEAQVESIEVDETVVAED